MSNLSNYVETNTHVLQNIFAIITLLLFIGAVIWIKRHSFWGPKVKNLFSSKMTIVAFLIGSFYFGTAWLDMISWKDNVSNSQSSTLEAGMPRTLLDRGFAKVVGSPEWEYREKSYSSPYFHFGKDGMLSLSFATEEFVDKEIKLKHKHLLGTDRTGRDTLYQILKGCRPAVLIGTLPLIVSIPLAMLMGIMAGFFGGRFDDFVVYIYSTLASIPGLLLLLALVAVLGRGMPQIAFGLGVTGWVGLCRLTRGETLKLRELEYVQAARVLGVSNFKIILKHIVPNLGHIVIITAVLAFTGLVLTESVLAYLGLGLDNSWGSLIDDARVELSRDPIIWWNLIYASGALLGLVLSINVLGDSLRDVLDPKVGVDK